MRLHISLYNYMHVVNLYMAQISNNVMLKLNSCLVFNPGSKRNNLCYNTVTDIMNEDSLDS